jgi:hypothetical protein
MSRHASRKPSRKAKVPQHEAFARNKRRQAAQRKEYLAKLDAQSAALEAVKAVEVAVKEHTS